MLPVAKNRTRRAVSLAAAACALLLPLLVAQPAQAWWRGCWGCGWGWRGGVVVGPPVIVAPPIVAVAPPPMVVAPAPVPYARWVPPHYNRWGRWVPGHWA